MTYSAWQGFDAWDRERHETFDAHWMHRRFVGKTYKLKSWAKPRRDGTSLIGPKRRKARGWRKHIRRLKAA